MFNTATFSWSKVLLDIRRSPIRCQIHSSQPKTQGEMWFQTISSKQKDKNIFCSSDSSCTLLSLLWLLTPLTDVAQVDCCSLCQTLSCVHITVSTLTITLCEMNRCKDTLYHNSTWNHMKVLHICLKFWPAGTHQCSFQIYISVLHICSVASLVWDI